MLRPDRLRHQHRAGRPFPAETESLQRPQHKKLRPILREGTQKRAHRKPDNRRLQNAHAPVTVVVAEALGLKAGAPAIRFSRLRLIDDRPLVLEDIWLPHDRFKALLTIDTREFGDLLYPLYEQYCGVMVASAQETLSAEAVSAKNARLLELEAGEPVIVIERVALSADRQPLEWRQSRGPASEFRYQVEIR